MTMIKVYNNNDHDFQEKYKGQMIVIKAHEYFEMDYEEAVDFIGKAVPIIRMKNGLPDPRSLKRLKITEEDKAKGRAVATGDKTSDQEKVFVCMGCSKEFRTKNGLLKHIKDKHQSQMIDEEARDELLDNEDLD